LYVNLLREDAAVWLAEDRFSRAEPLASRTDIEFGDFRECVRAIVAMADRVEQSAA
jgi:hypothetical protein